MSRLDVALGLAVVVAGALEVWVPALSSGEQAMGHRPALTLAALVAGAALVLRRVRPLLSLLLVLAAVQAQIWLAGTESLAGLAAVLVALFAVGMTSGRQPALLGLGVAAWWVLLQGEDLADHAFGLLLVGGPWVAGRLVRGRQLLLDELALRNRELEAEQRKTAVLAAAEERARIARDMHDVVAHSLTVMIVQAQAAEAHLASARGDPERAAEAVSAVQHVGRDALLQTRRLVGALADDGAPALSPSPGLAEVDALVGTVRGAGLPVTLTVSGPLRAMPPGVDGTGIPPRPGGPDERGQALRPRRCIRADHLPAGRAGRRGVRRWRRTGCSVHRRGIRRPGAAGHAVPGRGLWRPPDRPGPRGRWLRRRGPVPAPLHEVPGALDRMST